MKRSLMEGSKPESHGSEERDIHIVSKYPIVADQNIEIRRRRGDLMALRCNRIGARSDGIVDEYRIT